MSTLQEQMNTHAAYVSERVQSTIDTIATRYFNQPGQGEYIALSDEFSFPDLRHIQVSLADRTLALTEPSGEVRPVVLAEFITELTIQNYDLIRRLRRALGQRADGEPLCSGTGIEG
jgi:hypothetical protein